VESRASDAPTRYLFDMAKHPDAQYREAALRLLPHVCARCGREFEGRRLRELTVHHKDGDHHNNPPDGSNWEMLCIYCHENEHARFEDFKAAKSGSDPNQEKSRSDPQPARHRALEGLADMLKKKK
jgi:hypothetical protein